MTPRTPPPPGGMGVGVRRSKTPPQPLMLGGEGGSLEATLTSPPPEWGRDPKTAPVAEGVERGWGFPWLMGGGGALRPC